MTNNGREIE